MKTRVIDKSRIGDEIKTIISKVARINLFEIDENVAIREELGIDSLMVIEILARCEKNFTIKIDESKLESIQTIRDFIDHVASLIK